MTKAKETLAVKLSQARCSTKISKINERKKSNTNLQSVSSKNATNNQLETQLDQLQLTKAEEADTQLSKEANYQKLAILFRSLATKRSALEKENDALRQTTQSFHVAEKQLQMRFREAHVARRRAEKQLEQLQKL